jgi:hypothetical protein
MPPPLRWEFPPIELTPELQARWEQFQMPVLLRGRCAMDGIGLADHWRCRGCGELVGDQHIVVLDRFGYCPGCAGRNKRLTGRVARA